MSYHTVFEYSRVDKIKASFKAAGIVWAAVYFAVGAIKAFTLNSNDTWASVALLLGLFLLPLPITIMAVWFSKGGGKALLGCVALNVIAVIAVLVRRHASPVSDMGHFVVAIGLYNIPHLLFGYGYLRAHRVKRDTVSSGHTR